MISQDWHKFFMNMAKIWATRSKDISTRVGCVICQDKLQVSQGYNGLPKGIPDTPEILENRELKLKLTKHAEANAIRYARKEDLVNATLYVTAPPCTQCAGDIIQSDIAVVRYLKPTDDFESRYADDIKLSLETLRKANITVIMVEE